jgi:hypothetical protein
MDLRYQHTGIVVNYDRSGSRPRHELKQAVEIAILRCQPCKLALNLDSALSKLS